MKKEYTAESRKVWIDTADLELMIDGIATLSRTLWKEAYSLTPTGVLMSNKDLTQGENAIEQINNYHEMTSGALELISSTTSLISQMFANGDAAIVFTEDSEAE